MIKLPLVRRCLWCKKRIGQERFFLNGEWQSVPSIQHLMGEVAITDTICPECKKIADEQEAQRKQQLKKD